MNKSPLKIILVSLTLAGISAGCTKEEIEPEFDFLINTWQFSKTSSFYSFDVDTLPKHELSIFKNGKFTIDYDEKKINARGRFKNIRKINNQYKLDIIHDTGELFMDGTYTFLYYSIDTIDWLQFVEDKNYDPLIYTYYRFP